MEVVPRRQIKGSRVSSRWGGERSKRRGGSPRASTCWRYGSPALHANWRSNVSSCVCLFSVQAGGDARPETDKKLYEKTLINLSCSRQVSIRLFNQSLYAMKLTFSTHCGAGPGVTGVMAAAAAATCTFVCRFHACAGSLSV